MKSSTTVKGIEIKEYPDKTYEEIEQMVKEETEKNLRKVFKKRGLSDDEINLKLEKINAHINSRKVVKNGK